LPRAPGWISASAADRFTAVSRATIRHAVFGIVLGLVEDALSKRSEQLTS
jgi:hypothetical protein